MSVHYLNGSGPPEGGPLASYPELQKVALVGASEILAESTKPTRWAWDGIVEEGSVCMLAGAPGGGKTTLMFLVLVLRASPRGGDLFGASVAGARKGSYVVLIEGEHGSPSACRKLVNSCRLLGAPTTVLNRVIVIARKAVLIGDARWKEIVRMVAAGVVSDIAIDTIARCAPGDGSSEKEQTAIMHTVAEAIEAAPTVEQRPVAWINAHTRKGESTGTVDDVSGSAARTAQCDAVALVTPNREDGRMVSSTITWAKVREADEVPDPCTYIVRGDSFAIVEGPTGTRRRRLPEEDLDDSVYEKISMNPGIHGADAINDLLKKRRKDVGSSVRRLLESNRIRSVREGRVTRLYVCSDTKDGVTA